jgi:hypothetical protein
MKLKIQTRIQSLHWLKRFGYGMFLIYASPSIEGSNLKCVDSINKQVPETSPLQKSRLNFEISQEQLDVALKQINQSLIQETLFVIPNNDGEAKRTVEILKALKVPHLLESKQSWGATLDKEKIAHYLTIEIRRIVIFEIRI